MSVFRNIGFSVEDGVAKIVLNRPDAGNALNPELTRELLEAATRCDSNPDVRAVMITGTGRMFCAGGDLKAFAQYETEMQIRLKALADDLHRAISTFARMAAPIVIAVNGTAAGAGFSLALIGDIVIASDKAKFTMAYTAAGLSPDGSSSYYLPRVVGLRRAQELYLTNRVLTAGEAAEWGVVTRVVPDAELAAEAEAMARKLAKGPREANAVVKKLLMITDRNGLEEQMEIEGRDIARMASLPDGREGIRAFIEKRPPVFE